MQGQDKTKERLINELAEMRRRIAELETAEIQRKRAKEATKCAYAGLNQIFNSAGRDACN